MLTLTLVQFSFVLHIMSSLNSKVVDTTLMFLNIKLYSQWLWVEQTTNLESASPVIENILSDWFCLQLTHCQVNLAFAACALRGLMSKQIEVACSILSHTSCLFHLTEIMLYDYFLWDLKVKTGRNFPHSSPGLMILILILTLRKCSMLPNQGHTLNYLQLPLIFKYQFTS